MNNFVNLNLKYKFNSKFDNKEYKVINSAIYVWLLHLRNFLVIICLF